MDNVDYNIIKQIGKGAFSNVFLCKNKIKKGLLSSLSGIFEDKNESDKDLFIIKEINLDVLVKKYVSKLKNKHKIKIKKSIQLTFTPYDNKLQNIMKIIENEEAYYYKRLKDLIDSEIEILKKLNNINIIQYYSSCIDNQIYYIKMEYCNYGDLYSILKDIDKDNDFKLRNIFNGFDNNFILKFLIDTINGLKYLHDLNIIHRDIKLQNILIKKNKDLNSFVFIISDFGFACFDIECDLNQSLNLSEFEYSASALKKKYYKLCGTPYYMAPEIILNLDEFEQLVSEEKKKNFVKFYDKKVDMWSYGMCIFELIFNSLIFIENTENNINDIHDIVNYFSGSKTQTEIYNIIDNKKIIDEDMKIILKKLLTINPTFRFSIYDLYDYINTNTNMNLLLQKCELRDSKKDKKNKNMNTNVIYEPINLQNGEINYLSWENINKASSFMMKISVDNDFMKWMFKKNN